MNRPTSQDIADFAKNVKVGDTVAVYDYAFNHPIYTSTIQKITPTGRIKLESGSVFKPNGFRYGDQLYRHRHIWRATGSPPIT